MAFELMNFNGAAMQKYTINEILKCNDYTLNYGLTLTEPQALELAETRTYALKASGRIELGGGIIDKIIEQFCDSPYITMYNYTDTIHELVELFYYYKNESLDLVNDYDLIKFMKQAFDGACQGSLELLASKALDTMAHNVRFGLPLNFVEQTVLDKDELTSDGEFKD